MNSTQYSYWMGDTPELESLLIGNLCLPGSHDAGSDKEAPNFQLPQEITQDISPHAQIMHGIRALDLRVAFYDGYEPGDPARFQLFHKTSSGRNIGKDIISALQEFYQSPRAQREIIVLDFHEFRDFTLAAHQELQSLIAKRLDDRLIPMNLSNSTLGDIWTKHPGKNIVVAYNHGERITQFWYGVDQYWMGENTPSTAELKEYMDSITDKYKSPHDLTAIQCAKYVWPFFVPDDFTDKIDSWFESIDQDSYIQSFYIINTDWATRSQLVKNCKHANIIRAKNS